MKLRRGTYTLLFLPALWLCLDCSGQTLGSKAAPKIKGFKVAEPFDPPYETQTKSVIQGGKALPQPGGKTLLSEGVIVRTFTITNTPQLIVQCQECVYDSAKHEVNSSGPIHMQTADGKFKIEGVGFLFQQTNSSLFISNKVHTLIQSASFAQGSNTVARTAEPESGPLVIDSVQFRYEGPSERGVWREQVRVSGTNLVLTSEVLTGELVTQTAAPDKRQVRSLLAETNVAVEYRGLHATGGRLTYAPETGLIRLVEQAIWEADQRHGRGDELILDRTNQIFQVNGHAALYLPGQTLGEGGFLSYTNLASTQAKSTNSLQRTIEIFCDNYEIRTNWAIFRDQVQLNQQVDHTNRGKMTCQKAMTVTFAGSNQLQTLTAEKKVVLEEGDKKVTGGHAIYTHTNTTLEVTEQPKWQDRLRSGEGDLIRLNTQLNEMLVQGNASMSLPANELATQFSSLTTTTNRPPKTGTNQFAQVFCEQYLLRPDKSVFQGGVYFTHPEMNLTCENLAILVPYAGITNLVAQQNVAFDLKTAKEKVHGTGDQAVYSFGLVNTVTNGMRPINELTLTGTPAVLVTTNITSRNDTLIWDRNRDKLFVPGSNYTIQGMAKAINTNIFVLPKRKLTK